MNENPIWTKDSMLSDRSLFLPLLISFGNLILFILFIANLYYINLNGLQTGEIRYAGFLQMYYFVAIGLFLFLLLLAPAITVSGMSMEEDEHMLELLLETDLDSRSIIFGKLYSELSTLGTFLLSTLPFLATVFIYGGIPYTYLFLYFTFYALSCVFLSSLGIACTGLAKNSVYATILAYGISFLFYAALFYGIYAVQNTRYFVYALVLFLLLLILSSLFFLTLGRKMLEKRDRGVNP